MEGERNVLYCRGDSGFDVNGQQRKRVWKSVLFSYEPATVVSKGRRVDTVLAGIIVL